VSTCISIPSRKFLTETFVEWVKSSAIGFALWARTTGTQNLL